MGNQSSKKHFRSSGSYLEALSSYNFEVKEDFDEREHLAHTLFREVFKTNFLSPIQDILSNPKSRILDVGCGSGFWLMEMSADFPKPSYVGIDSAPVFPKSTFPNNIKFCQMDLLKGLPYDDNTFDFIHVRALAYEFTESQWETFVYRELARLLKPGGWLEVGDYDLDLLYTGPVLKKLNRAIINSLSSNNINPRMTERHHPLIKSTPSLSSTVYHKRGVLPLSSNDRNENKLAEFGAQFMKSGCKFIYLGPIGQSMRIKRDNIESYLDAIEKEFKKYQTKLYLHRFYVQKVQKEVVSL